MTQTFPYDWVTACNALISEDPILGAIITRYKGETLLPRGDPFYTLVRSIIGQQISVQAAQAVWERFKTATGGITAARILASPGETLLGAGLSRRKVEYVKGIAEHAKMLEETRWHELDDEAAITLLCTLRGVGRWTAEMLLIFSLLRSDILPLGDLGLIKAVSLNYGDGAKLTPEAVEKIATKWRPFRSVATWYLWRSLDPEPVNY